MVDLVTDHLKSTKKTGKKWLFVQEAEAATIPAVQNWNEGYLPTNKFLYFPEKKAALSEEKNLLRTKWMN